MNTPWRVNRMLFSSLLLTVLLLAGCATVGPEADDQPGLDPSIERMQPGDKLTVILTDIPNGPVISEQTISQDGEITLHLNYRVTAGGKLRKELQDEIRNHYVPQFYPRCTVTIRSEDRFFFVEGQVKAPNRYIYAGELTVLKAVTAAGGFTDYAKRWAVEVRRLNGKRIIINCDKALEKPKLDLPIYPGDIIHVPRRIV